jgi:hypothetical protein
MIWVFDVNQVILPRIFPGKIRKKMVSPAGIAGIVIGVLVIVAGIVVGVLFGLKIITIPSKNLPYIEPTPAPANATPAPAAPANAAPAPVSPTVPAPTVAPPPPAPAAPPPPPPAPVVPNPVEPADTMFAANGTKFVLSKTRMCNMSTGAPQGSNLQELISNCATTTKLGGHSQCVGIQVSKDQFGVSRYWGCLSTAPGSQYGGISSSTDSWIMESQENLNYQ